MQRIECILSRAGPLERESERRSHCEGRPRRPGGPRPCGSGLSAPGSSRARPCSSASTRPASQARSRADPLARARARPTPALALASLSSITIRADSLAGSTSTHRTGSLGLFVPALDTSSSTAYSTSRTGASSASLWATTVGASWGGPAEQFLGLSALDRDGLNMGCTGRAARGPVRRSECDPAAGTAGSPRARNPIEDEVSAATRRQSSRGDVRVPC